ncbi:MAG: putative small secreted protein [Desulforhopalus sp.]
MIRTIKISLSLCLLMFGLSSCSTMSNGGKEVQVPVQPLSCIAVIPASTSVDKDDTISYEDARLLERGAAHATSYMADQLSDNTKVRLINSAQMSVAVKEVSGGISGTIKALGEKMNCEGVLITTIRRYVQRDGTELAVDTPASADFKMVLRHAPTGAILWSADFQETQQTLLSDIFSYNKMQKRGFHWVTAEELLEQGIKQRLDECPYLQ